MPNHKELFAIIDSTDGVGSPRDILASPEKMHRYISRTLKCQDCGIDAHECPHRIYSAMHAPAPYVRPADNSPACCEIRIKG